MAQTKAQSNPQTKLTVSCGSHGLEFDLCKEAVDSWAGPKGIQVQIITTPNDSNERLALYQQMLGAQSSDIDVYQIDVVWPGSLANHLLDLSPYVSPELRQQHFSGAINNNTVAGRLVALPWFMDAGLLYYRKDLLDKHGEQAPKTWDDLERISKKIMAVENASSPQTDLWGYVFQGRSYEGLTCNALEWIASFGGGTIVDAKGTITINNPQAAQALNKVASWIGSISPPGVLNYAEEEARGAFQSGNAIFMRNWPYAWGLLNGERSQLRGKVGIAPLPAGAAGQKGAATLGGWGLAVSRYSKAPKEAAELVLHLTSLEQQRTRFQRAQFNPTYPALYEDQKLLAQNPQLKLYREAFMNAVSRPAHVTGQRYNRVSSEFWTSTHKILNSSQKLTAEAELKILERKLKQISRNGKW